MGHWVLAGDSVNSAASSLLLAAHGRPAPPARLAAISIKEHFQGDWFQSRTYSAAYQAAYPNAINGAIPFYGAALPDYWMVGDGHQILDQLCQAEDITHVQVFLTRGGSGYNEAGQPYGADQIIKPSDCWSNFALYTEVIDAILAKGKLPHYVIYAEGDDGFAWVDANLDEYLRRMTTGFNRLPYGPVTFAFDGVWPGSYSVDRMQYAIPTWGSKIRAAGGYTGFWFSGPPGEDYLWIVDEGDYKKDWMDALDLVLSTNQPSEAACTSMANKARYMVPSPNFSQCQADQGGDFLLFDNSQGPRVWLNIEYLTRQTVFDPTQTYRQPVLDARQVAKNLNCQGWG